MKRTRFFVTGVITAAALFGVSLLAITPPAFACGGSSEQNAKNLRALKSTLADMNTTDPAVMDQRIKQFSTLVEQYRSLTRGQETAQTLALEDALNFWREKRAQVATGGAVEVQAGKRWTAYLQTEVYKIQEPIVGTWNWWNGYTVTFNDNGGATYQGSSLVQSGVGRWQNTGGNNFHVHWLSSNTNDYFTLSPDGTKIQGKFDGKPGVSTRRC